MRQCMYHKGHEMLKKALQAQWWQIPQVFVRYWVGWGTDHSIRWNRIGWPFPTLQHNKKEVGTRNLGNFLWMQKVFKGHVISAVTQKRRSTHAKDCITNLQQSLEVRTNLSLQGNESDSGLINNLKHWRRRLSTWSFHRMAIRSFFHVAPIFVITMATKQSLVVNLELGFVESFILEWTVFLSLVVPDEWLLFFACLRFTLLAPTGGFNSTPYRAHVLLMHSCCVVIFVIVHSHTLTSRITHGLRFAQKHSSRNVVHHSTLGDTKHGHSFLTYLEPFLQRAQTLRRSTATAEWRFGWASTLYNLLVGAISSEAWQWRTSVFHGFASEAVCSHWVWSGNSMWRMKLWEA